ncbi:hypothetical protein M885DRAFT_511422 [Pelagophyceae sp. CCMP2097]|nr:hypothetical protein M885DRAFT_511422 [Pelagophyceae sp. CCMP2097]
MAISSTASYREVAYPMTPNRATFCSCSSSPSAASRAASEAPGAEIKARHGASAPAFTIASLCESLARQTSISAPAAPSFNASPASAFRSATNGRTPPAPTISSAFPGASYACAQSARAAASRVAAGSPSRRARMSSVTDAAQAHATQRRMRRRISD